MERSLSISQAPKGVALTQSCRVGQFSYEYGGSNAPFSNGLFTRAFVDAISGRSPEADADQNGVVTLGEIRDYLESRVPKDAQLYCNGMQNPTFTMMKGASFSDIADYKLFEDMPIFGHHPSDWRRGQTFCREAEALEKDEKYAETLERIKEAYRILPDVPEVAHIKERIEKHDSGAQAQEAYEKSKQALNAKQFQEALKYIDQAIQLDTKNSTYPVYRELIVSQQRFAEHQITAPPEPPFVTPDPPKPVPGTSDDDRKNKPSPIPGSREAGAVKEIKIADVKVKFRWCPPGEFKMGSPKTRKVAAPMRRNTRFTSVAGSGSPKLKRRKSCGRL